VLPHLADGELAEHGPQPARVVGIRMGDGDHVEPHGAAVPEIGRHHALAHVEARAAARPAVHEEPGSPGHLDEDRVPLSDVEEGDAEAAIARGEKGPGHRRQPGHEEQAAGAARPPPMHADGQRGSEHPCGHGHRAGRRNVRLRMGTAAASHTASRSRITSAQPRFSAREPASSLTAAAASPKSPTVVAAPARGTTARFAARPISESWLKCTAMTGRTAACAPALTAMAAAARGGQPNRSSAAVPGAARYTMPAVAAKESWNPGSQRSPGRHARSASAARASALGSWDSRSSRTPPSRMSPMMVARSTEACAPTTRAKPTSAAAATPAVTRRETPTMLSVAKIDAETRATLKPDTAST